MIAAFGLLLSAAASAQLLPFNSAGVTFGHYHIIVPDPAAAEKMWADISGGQASGDESQRFIKLPGAFIVISPGDARPGTQGSAVSQLIFLAKDLKTLDQQLRAAGVTILSGDQESLSAEFPGGLWVAFVRDPFLQSPIAHFGLDIYAIDREAERAWWTNVFGAETEILIDYVSQRTSIPGAGLEIGEAKVPPAKTQGRTLDHAGVNVKNVNEYCEKLGRRGILCERTVGVGTPAAMVTSPAGVRVEINQGLENR